MTIFADSAQAIYGFTTDQESDGPAEKTLVERLKEGIEAGPTYQHAALLRSALMALYDFVEGPSRVTVEQKIHENENDD